MNWIDVLENYSRNSIISDVAEMSVWWVSGDGWWGWDEKNIDRQTDGHIGKEEKKEKIRRKRKKEKTMRKMGKDIWDWIESR
jgi:hypothetical protein